MPGQLRHVMRPPRSIVVPGSRNSQTSIERDEVETRPTASYIFTVGELCRMHREAELEPVELVSSLNSEPYQIGLPRLILVSSKGGGNGDANRNRIGYSR